MLVITLLHARIQCEVFKTLKPSQLFRNICQVINFQPHDTKFNTIFSGFLVLISRWGFSYNRVSSWTGCMVSRPPAGRIKKWHWRGIVYIILSEIAFLEGTARAVDLKWIQPGDWVSPKTNKTNKTNKTTKTAETVGDCITENTISLVLPREVVLLPHTTVSFLGLSQVELQMAAVVDPAHTHKLHLLIGLVGGTRIWPNEGADVIFGMGCDAVFGFAAGLITVIDFLAGLGGDFLGVMVAIWVTLLCQHEMSLCIVQISFSFIFASDVHSRRFPMVSACVLPISVDSILSGWCQLMSVTQCQRLNIRVGFTTHVKWLLYSLYLSIQLILGY